jgi:hypothetical protein
MEIIMKFFSKLIATLALIAATSLTQAAFINSGTITFDRNANPFDWNGTANTFDFPNSDGNAVVLQKTGDIANIVTVATARFFDFSYNSGIGSFAPFQLWKRGTQLEFFATSFNRINEGLNSVLVEGKGYFRNPTTGETVLGLWSFSASGNPLPGTIDAWNSFNATVVDEPVTLLALAGLMAAAFAGRRFKKA